MIKKVLLPGKNISTNDFEIYQSLGELITNYRKWHKLSQEKLAKLIGISVRELGNWERDRYPARTENLHDLSEVTGIPMQVCVALNADQPIWYSLWERRFAYSPIEVKHFISNELFKSHKQFYSKFFVKSEQITTNKHIQMILQYHQNIYGANHPLGSDVIKAASMICPDLNFIVFDSWGHYVGHEVCLPIKMAVYQHLKKQKVFERYLTPNKMSDIVALHRGFFVLILYFQHFQLWHF